MPNVTIYSTPKCPYCTKAKDYFKEHNVPYVEKDVAVDVAAREEMIHKTGQLVVPVIDIDGKIILGFDRPRIAELLGV